MADGASKADVNPQQTVNGIFQNFAPPVREQSPLRKAITAAYRRPEEECLAPLIDAATVTPEQAAAIRTTATKLIEALRAKTKGTGVEGLVQEYSLSSHEGVALMCLAEALLRIPDTATRDALIRDKIARGDWKSHIGGGRSLFVNAATWGLVITGKLTSTVNDSGLSAALTKLIARAGEPVIRRGVDMAMRMMGEQFVTGETIGEAIKRSKPLEEQGFQYSYDMLGEAATTAKDAERYYKDYENAIHAIGKASAGRGIYGGPGISIKLSALHPRYARVQAERVMAELLPRVKSLMLLSKKYDIGLNIDAEEADRLELSLDLLEELALDKDLAGWNGLGFVVQAYGRRCPFVLDYIIDLAQRAGRRIMVRLVKGAYWDAEIKRAQVDGLEDFPVFTRKVHTDVSYIACARKLLAARDVVFPQFATHNAQSMATIYHLAGPDFKLGDYEFQCLHGMGEPLYSEVVGKKKLDRPCRFYAPVGTHETLLAYLVRRLLENGANSSFVNRIADPAVPVASLLEDPVTVVKAYPVPGARHDRIAAPAGLFGPERANSAGLDLSNETALAALDNVLKAGATTEWKAAAPHAGGKTRPVLNPGDHNDVVGYVTEPTEADVEAAMQRAAASNWSSTPVEERAACLERAADRMQAEMPALLGLIMREAGKSMPNAIAEVREAIDFLRYYAAEARKTFKANETPLGPVVCISPWNFPLAIFIGQVTAALVAGNPVLAKPAEETPLIAAQGVRLLHEAGVPQDAVQLLPGDGKTGAALVGSALTAGVMFTGSTEVARLIQGQLAGRVLANGQPVPLIAETGGQNAMIVDSSALAEQVVADVIASAFDSAGQRCSALRILCLQEDVADRTLTMLKGALHELRIGRTDSLSVDVGPVITAEAKGIIEKHVDSMRALGHRIEQISLAGETGKGTFVPPTIIEMKSLADLKKEVFGPVLHVIRFKRDNLDRLIDEINATGYGLTFGLHTRLDDTIQHVLSRVAAGNLYVNRNIIGAVVGVQPFGGRGLSGTGPKAGGPLYLGRVTQTAPKIDRVASQQDQAAVDLARWLDENGQSVAAEAARQAAALSGLGFETELAGPVGERNVYALHPRGKVLLIPATEQGLYRQLAAALATGNSVVIDNASGLEKSIYGLPATVTSRITWADSWEKSAPFAGALIEGDAERVVAINKKIAALPGPLVLVQAATTEALDRETQPYNLDWLVEEVSVSVNTTAAGGNASLMSIG
ncbi:MULTISPECIES: trifunctional transcriptional regulator/proline dehydrogenase/L-glutamate gamma-semialdehyde dehydrogenase [Rhizobium/Agrobacterium group]|jgi:RHH-type proline utilization regulon transcriptional repressor/proline dehydrogenase/delta 1-pyrroline-5-carboxylate dehydrogenase|uniref:Bifunctional protein PutA n=1 Tax=Agrobacterium tumefaciens TaxID=358 RepID=A0AA86KTB5_AGRTU|nr:MULTISPECIES: trifunctional transcriptional regulator/proline dehydrogenase/L-glutamate gamma-semialdehyde dehydrogenase [Rhizobium/Agrobacterium group]AHK03953.1 proline dehydrogenase [Agrobacterium tumefaciens LBA4213 (Ach5)]AKC09703.1 bifunctional proline dehydrogenase/pyrroline-5-carboxylate dehydrogenase [Agrobacterium tumefaciens]EHJ96068.1 bifunctional proline dehydrogenase/pyrroline-5-carboxylate dehydrogenase [Agrobacterium tumefaciens 5A]MDP9562737.1 RHH-type proline utilization re